MTIGVDAQCLSRILTGMHRCVMGFLCALQRADRNNEYHLYSKRGFALPFSDERWRVRLVQASLLDPRTFWFLTGAVRTIAQDGLDIYWSTLNLLPFGMPQSMKKVVLVPDLVFKLYPETMETRNCVLSRLFFAHSIRRADRIITLSHSVRHSINEIYGIPLEAIEVAYPSPDPAFVSHPRLSSARYVAREYATSEDYICTVGTVEPRKNVITLIRAVKILKDRGHLRHQVLIVGGTGWKSSKIYRAVKTLGLTANEVKFLGHVPDRDLPLLYSGSSLFVFPSFYEGFGLPLAEAMACGTPIVASSAPPIPEVVQDAGILVPAHDPGQFADAISYVTERAEVGRALIEKGFKRLPCFCPDLAAKTLLGVFESLQN